MAEKKGVGHAYNVDFLNVVFAASSIFLLLSTVWMVWDDFDRDWKNTQRRFAQLQFDVTRAQYQAETRKVDRTKLQGLQAQQKAAEQNVRANRSKVDDLESKLRDVEIRLDRANRDYQYIKATYGSDPHFLRINGKPVVFAFAAIGALAGRAKLFQSRNYERYESAVDRGEALVTVSGSPELLQRSRRILEEHGALRFRHEETGEAI